MSCQSVQDALVAKMRQEIMAEEDRQVFEALDAVASECHDESHPGFGGPVSECAHPECVVRSVIEC